MANKGGRPKKTKKHTLEEVIHANRGMVKKLVNSFSYNFGGGVAELEELKRDLYQEGVLGIIEGYRKYDSGKGTKISTFIYFFVLGRIQTATALLFPAMRCPTTKISNDRYGFSLDDIVVEQEHVFSEYDSNMDDSKIDQPEVEDYLFHLTPAQADALRVKFGISELSKFPKLAPMREFLAKTGLNRLKTIKDTLRSEI